MLPLTPKIPAVFYGTSSSSCLPNNKNWHAKNDAEKKNCTSIEGIDEHHVSSYRTCSIYSLYIYTVVAIYTYVYIYIYISIYSLYISVQIYYVYTSHELTDPHFVNYVRWTWLVVIWSLPTMTVPGLESGHTILQLLGNRFGVRVGRVATTITRVTSLHTCTFYNWYSPNTMGGK